MKITKGLLNKILLFSTFLLLPVNLGYHFILPQSFVSGLLINFLQPTLYLQDILIWSYIIVNIGSLKLLLRGTNKYYIWFLYALFLSTLISSMYLLSLSLFLRTLGVVTYALIAKELNSKEEIRSLFIYALSWATFFISLLGILQWFKQGALFNNYLIFGEQPYNIATYGITIENFFGHARIPPYGTFMHPNTFAGFLVISLFLLLPSIRRGLIYKIAFIFGLIALFLTWSKVAWLAFAVSLAFYFVSARCMKKYIVYAVLLLGVSSLVLPIFTLDTRNPSIYRRVDLLDSTYRLIAQKPVFGYGAGSTPALIDKFFPLRRDIAFIQPPHNIFALITLESGVISLFLFFLVLISKQERSSYYLLLILQIIILGSFDHYLWTMPQTHLLMWFGILFL